MAKKKSVKKKAAPRKTKKKAAAPGWQEPRFDGVIFCFSGTLQHCKKKQAEALIAAEGGKIAKSVNADLNYLILGKSRGGKSAAEKKADSLNQQGASIAVLDELDFHQLFVPDHAAMVGMLSGGAEGVQRWNETVGLEWLQVEIVIRDMKVDEDIVGAKLKNVSFENCTFKQRFSQVDLKDATSCKFDGGELRSVKFQNAVDCSFRKAELWEITFHEARNCDFRQAVGSQVQWNFHLCDFRKAKIDFLHVNVLDGCNLAGGVFENIFSGGGRYWGCKSTNTIFDRCVFTSFLSLSFSGKDFTNASFVGVEFPEVDFSHANLSNCDFTRAKLKKANFSDADLTETNFTRADLTEARFTGAKFVDTRVDGANFTDSTTSGATFKNVNADKAKGLDLSTPAAKGAIGPNVRALEQAAKASREIVSSMRVTINGKPNTVHIRAGSRHAYSSMADDDKNRWHSGQMALGDAMLAVAARASDGVAELPTVTVKRSKCPLKPKAAQEVAMKAWCEVFGVPIPTDDELKEKQSDLEQRDGALVETLLAELRGGKKGIALWNARTIAEREREAKFRGADLSGVDLRGAQFREADFREANLSNAKLGAKGGLNLWQCDFAKADLSSAKFFYSVKHAKFPKANLSGAKMSGIEITAGFKGADLTNTDFSKSQFKYGDVKGVDLSQANLKGATFHMIDYDEHTVFPKGFKIKEGLKWAGQGKDPRLLKKVEKLAQAGPVSFDEFMTRLESNFDASRLKKATKMLKADSFQLFSEVTDESFTGVVKSQTDASLVYSCRLNKDGEFTCCTQNLNACGGLRGALCKHLLVLIIGLTKAEELDPTTINVWVAASKLQKPKLDKDAMSEVFLKYKGAEAGDIDWRPTETVPEDYYAF